MKSVRRILQLGICFLLIHGCSDDWNGKDKAAENGQNVLLEEKPETKTSVKKTDNTKDGISLFKSEEKPLNILIIGYDQRGTEASRADTIMIAQYHPGAKTAKVMSIMRDSYVFIPGYGKSKINHAYSWGGDQLLKETIEENFNVKADRTIKIDFQGFVSFIDKVLPKGIEVEVPAEMINYWKWDMEPGLQVLNGQELLNYVRFRKDSESDFGRVRRQQEVLEKIQKNILKQLTDGEGIKTVSSLIKDGKEAVDTDLALSDFLQLDFMSMLKPVESFDSLRIPIENSYQNVMTKDDGLVLEVDTKANAEAAGKFLSVE
ncbi:LCP family protein [Rossellomorea vietnamensis]|uniref:LCP family protein n=1 Tax=Rossellomorea vietnamensis TaxID=218284 RepID=UPI003CE6CC6C